jgi:hypothetical protein
VTRERLPPEKVAFILAFCRQAQYHSASWRLYRKRLYNPAGHPPPGRLENSALAANSRKKEYSVSLPLCLAGFWLIKGGVGGGGGGGGVLGEEKENSGRNGRAGDVLLALAPAARPDDPSPPGGVARRARETFSL